MASWRDKIVSKIAKSLSDDGYKLIVKAYEGSDYRKDRTQNLHDSYGCCVYYDGKKIKGSDRYMVSRATQGRYNYYTDEIEYGRQEIKDFFNNYTPNAKGFELVLAVAMFYGKYLEEQKGGISRKYKVISFVSKEAQDLANKYNGKAKKIGE